MDVDKANIYTDRHSLSISTTTSRKRRINLEVFGNWLL